MPEHFSALPEEVDKQAICFAVQDIIRDLHAQPGWTLTKIAEQVTEVLSKSSPLESSAVKVFLEKKTGRINSNNNSLPALYDYIIASYHKFPATTQIKAKEHWATLIPDEVEKSEGNGIDQSLNMIMKTWLKVGDSSIGKVSAKLFGDYTGDYILLRKSVIDPDIIVKSRLKIDRIGARNSLPRIRHYHHDRQAVERVSTGVLIPMVSNIYAVLQVEYGEGLEFLSLRNPIQWHFHKLMGFMTSMNMDRNILSARIVIERDGRIWDGVSPRFKRSDWKENKYVMERVGLLDQETSLTIPDI
jgi:hypothetical protein